MSKRVSTEQVERPRKHWRINVYKFAGRWRYAIFRGNERLWNEGTWDDESAARTAAGIEVTLMASAEVE